MTDKTNPPPDRGGRLLVMGDDGSPGADVAWLWVCNHSWPGWRAEVVTAIDPPFPPRSWDRPAEPVEWCSPHPRDLDPQCGLSSVRSLRVEEDRRITLGTFRGADLLVVGPGKLDRRSPSFVGSTTDWLLHYPSTPMAVIRSATPVRRVLACVDGSTHARAALAAFANLPWAHETEVVALAIDDGRAETELAAQQAVEILQPVGCALTVSIAAGKPTKQILRESIERDTQLVVLGTRGLTGWQRLRLGSTASHVVRAVGCNSLVACVEHVNAPTSD